MGAFLAWCQDSLCFPASRVLAVSALPGSLCRRRRFSAVSAPDDKVGYQLGRVTVSAAEWGGQGCFGSCRRTGALR
jgi:hypothetical protein